MTVALAVWLAWAGAARAADAAADDESPHVALKSDGELDMESCAVCHTDDLSLERSKLETCTVCHSETAHAGANEHVTASASAVKKALETQPKDGPELPLGDDGRMYCGTCHLYHDPKVMEEHWLAQAWLPPDSGVSASIRLGVLDRWAALAAKSDDKAPLGQFAEKGTRLLRLPVDQGQLCRQCHGVLP